MKKCISKWSFFLIAFSFVGVVGINVYAYSASTNVVADKIKLSTFIPLPFQMIFLLLSFLAVLFSTVNLSKYVSKKMSGMFTYDILNRLSGDIRSVDINLCTNFHGFVYNLCLILASFVYNAISLQEWYMILGYSVLIGILFFIAFKINRYIMWGRR